MNEFELKNLIIDIGKRMWQREYVSANDGNISVRLDEKYFLVTPSGVSKGFMKPEMILKIDKDCNIVSFNKDYKISSEIKMHLLIYKERPDIKSVIHSHPIYSTAFSIAGIELNKCILPESAILLGAVPIAPYATPSTDEVPESILPYIKNTDVIMLANHGVVTCGQNLIEAYFKLETLEHTAKITFLAMQLGNINFLNDEQVKKLMEVREKFGLKNKIIMCQTKNNI